PRPGAWRPRRWRDVPRAVEPPVCPRPSATTISCSGQRPGLDPDPAVGRAERGQKRDDSVRLSQHFLLQDYLAGIVDNAHRRLFHRHIKTHEMRHLIAPSSMLEVEPTSIHSSSQKGLHTPHPRLSRSRRDTPYEQGVGAWSRGMETSSASDRVGRTAPYWPSLVVCAGLLKRGHATPLGSAIDAGER